MLATADNAKKAKIKSGFKVVFYKYQAQELEIKVERFCKEQENALEIRIDEDEDELSDVELYQTSPSEFDTETELT
jgi:hypothetical protein